MTIRGQEIYFISIFSMIVLLTSMSVHNTTQPSYIFSSASYAVVAAVAGDFIPLIVEFFGVWTSSALSILHSIADRTIYGTTTHSDIFRKVARRNLLQQLSVCMFMDK